MFEREPEWGSPYVVNETQTDLVFEGASKWVPILDVRSDISYRLFTSAHDIVDQRPRYETIASEVSEPYSAVSEDVILASSQSRPMSNKAV